MVDTPTNDIYLFLFCPRVHIKAGELLVHVPSPSDAFFWSRDPYSSSQLTEHAACTLGLPRVFMQARVGGPAWSRAGCGLLRQFHFAKGFDPARTDIVNRLGYPHANLDGLGRLVFQGSASPHMIYCASC
ncbi:hypothetical protein B0H14DRAFT_2407874 [Mycena olivaceomarginata]|nr:hypothetical protein B0H14DRAFT_2407874 [Mycena olivaceomarginata]